MVVVVAIPMISGLFSLLKIFFQLVTVVTEAKVAIEVKVVMEVKMVIVVMVVKVVIVVVDVETLMIYGPLSLGKISAPLALARQPIEAPECWKLSRRYWTACLQVTRCHQLCKLIPPAFHYLRYLGASGATLDFSY